jgi:hypothetical protein
MVLIISCKSRSIAIKRTGIFIRATEYSSKKSVVIKSKPDDSVFEKLRYVSFYNPSDNDIINAEKLLKNNVVTLINNLNGNKSFDPIKDKDLYKEWTRQYLPFIDSHNEKFILVSLLKCCHNNVGKCYPTWKKEIIFILEEGNCSGTARFVVNLTKNTVSIF